MSLTKRHAWADETERTDALCVAVFLDRSVPSVLDAFGADVGSGRDTTHADAAARWSSEVEPVQIWACGKHVIAAAPNGWLCSLPGVLAALAAGGDAVSVFWNINRNMQVLVVRGGVVTRAFDPLFRDEDEGDGEVLVEEADLRFGEEEAASSALALLERLTGFAAAEETMLDQAHPTYDVHRSAHPNE